jgi:hypothetical protein
MAVVMIRILALVVLLSGCTDLNVLDQKEPRHPLPTANTAQRWVDSDLTGTTELVSNRLQLASTVPPLVSDCEAEPGLNRFTCRDADSDGLSDLWERIALHRLRPFVRMHPDEPLFRDYYGNLVASGRVMLTEHGHIRVLMPIVFSNDYGRCSATQHRGDPERIALDLIPYDSRTVEIAGAYTASHEGTPLDGSRLLIEDELEQLEYTIDEVTGMPRWVVYSSIGKHALYPNAQACASKGQLICTNDDCASSGDASNDLLPDVYNVGEPRSSDYEFEGCDSESPFRETTPPLTRNQIWGEEKYCGDIPKEAADSYSGSCAGPIRDKLLSDPFG